MSTWDIYGMIEVACANNASESCGSSVVSGASGGVSLILFNKSKSEISCNIEDLSFTHGFLYCGVGLVAGCRPSMIALVSLDRASHVLRSSLFSWDHLSLGNLVLF